MGNVIKRQSGQSLIEIVIGIGLMAFIFIGATAGGTVYVTRFAPVAPIDNSNPDAKVIFVSAQLSGELILHVAGVLGLKTPR